MCGGGVIMIMTTKNNAGAAAGGQHPGCVIMTDEGVKSLKLKVKNEECFCCCHAGNW